MYYLSSQAFVSLKSISQWLEWKIPRVLEAAQVSKDMRKVSWLLGPAARALRDSSLIVATIHRAFPHYCTISCQLPKMMMICNQLKWLAERSTQTHGLAPTVFLALLGKKYMSISGGWFQFHSTSSPYPSSTQQKSFSSKAYLISFIKDSSSNQSIKASIHVNLADSSLQIANMVDSKPVKVYHPQTEYDGALPRGREE